MDEKSSIDTRVSDSDDNRIPNMNSARRARVAGALFAVLFMFYYTCYYWFAVPISKLPAPLGLIQDYDFPLPISTEGLVPLEAHIISKCPDTRVRASLGILRPLLRIK